MVFVAHSFFTGHAIAEDVAGRGPPLLMLSEKDKCDAALVQAKHLTQQVDCTQTMLYGNYEQYVHQNPKLGQKSPIIVPFFANCWFMVAELAMHWRGKDPHTVVAKSGDVPRTVDGQTKPRSQCVKWGAK